MPGGLGFCLCLFCPWDRSTDAGDQKYSGVEALIFFSPNEGGQKARPDPPSFPVRVPGADRDGHGHADGRAATSPGLRSDSARGYKFGTRSVCVASLVRISTFRFVLTFKAPLST